LRLLCLVNGASKLGYLSGASDPWGRSPKMALLGVSSQRFSTHLRAVLCYDSLWHRAGRIGTSRRRADPPPRDSSHVMSVSSPAARTAAFGLNRNLEEKTPATSFCFSVAQVAAHATKSRSLLSTIKVREIHLYPSIFLPNSRNAPRRCDRRLFISERKRRAILQNVNRTRRKQPQADITS